MSFDSRQFTLIVYVIDVGHFYTASNYAKSNVLLRLQMAHVCIADCGSPDGSTVVQDALTESFVSH